MNPQLAVQLSAPMYVSQEHLNNPGSPAWQLHPSPAKAPWPRESPPLMGMAQWRPVACAPGLAWPLAAPYWAYGPGSAVPLNRCGKERAQMSKVATQRRLALRQVSELLVTFSHKDNSATPKYYTTHWADGPRDSSLGTK